MIQTSQFVKYSLLLAVVVYFFIVIYPILKFKRQALIRNIDLSWSKTLKLARYKALNIQFLEALALADEFNIEFDFDKLVYQFAAGGNPLNVIKIMVNELEKGTPIRFDSASARDLCGEKAG